VSGQLAGTLEVLRALWETYQAGEETNEEYETNIYEYGLSFDYVPSDTFHDMEDGGFFRYQLSWGGPSDEFRFFADPEGECYRVEYWFMDWFDGACRRLHGEEKDFMLEIWEWFREGGAVESELQKAKEEK
jgi:hypothetical protein